MIRTILLFVVFLLSSMPQTASSQTAGDLFQQALTLERSQGDIKGAMRIYERIVTEFPDNRTVAARALLQLGKGYERTGRDDARAVYERLLSDYSDQSELVAEARNRVQRLLAVETLTAAIPNQATSAAELNSAESLLGPAFPFIDAGSALSHDGRFVVFTDWNTSRIGYLKLGETQIHWVTPEADEGNSWSFAFWGRFSPDNREIAYAWGNGVDGSKAIRVFNRDSGETREILNDQLRFGRGPNEGHAGVFDWTSDGSHILTEIWPAAGIVRWALMDKNTGAVSHYVERNRLDSMPGCLLNDRYVLFDEHIGDGGVSRVLRADLFEGSVQPFLPEGVDSRLLGCSDDKQAAVVSSNEFGVFGAWLYRLDSGMPSGPGLHLQDLPEGATSAGGLISDSGRMLFQMEPERDTSLYRYEGDSILGRTEAPALNHGILGFSPDGSRVAYRFQWNVLLVQEETGETRSLALLRRYGRLRWLADGSGFVGNWYDGSDSFSSRIDLESGLPTDTLSGYMSPGQRGVDLLMADRRNSETVCVGVYPRGAESRRDLVCYSDSRSVFPGRWHRVMQTGDIVSVMAPRDEEGGAYLTEVDVPSGKSTVVSDSNSPNWTWQLSQSNEDFVLDFQEGSIYRFSMDGSERRKVFDRFSEMRRIRAFSLHPTENLILIASLPRSMPTRGAGILNDLWEHLK